VAEASTRGGPIGSRFRIAEVVRRGSSGRVLKVTDAETGEPRALKIVSGGGEEAILLVEFEQLVVLRHRSLPRVLEAGRTHGSIADLPAGHPYFLAEWIAGDRCDARAWSGHDLGARVWAMTSDVAGALATLHAAGVVHGDVAPQNILLAQDGHAVLVDLGRGSETGAWGTPAYMAPEALAGAVEPRSDLYGLGATIARLVTGRPMGSDPPDLPGLPRPLGDLVGRMVARDPGARPISALAVLDELDRIAPVIAPGSPRGARPGTGAAAVPIAWPGAATVATVIGAIPRSLASGTAVITAESSLAALHAAHPVHVEVAGRYARLLVSRARYHEARATATGGGPRAGLRVEAAGLVAFHLGEVEAADAAFAALETCATASGDGAAAGRASSLRGMVAQQRGQLGLASDRYREAVRRLGEAGEVLAAASAELHLGTVLVERGRASDALPRLTAAGRVFAELGAIVASCTAELGRCRALLLLGQIHDARAAAEAVIARAGAAPDLHAFALIAAGNARHRLGDDAGALGNYREALALAIARGDAPAQISAYIALAEAGQRDGDDPAIETLGPSDDERDRWMLARGRRALRDPSSVSGGSGSRGAGALGEATLALARACAELAARAADADRIDRAFRGHAIAAQLAHRARAPELARAQAERARVAHATWITAIAPAFRAAIDGDPDLARLPGARPGEQARPARDDPQAAQLRRLLALSHRFHTEASVERILDDAIDTAIELVSAERGFVLLRQGTGELAAAVSRNFSAGELDAGSGQRPVSPSLGYLLAERAAQTGEPVVLVDALVDALVDEPSGPAAALAATAALRPRSVIAVPLRKRGAITGCLYVEHRLRDAAFDAAAASVLGELSAIVAIAIENARLAGELQRTTRELAERNGQLLAELAERDAELLRARVDLPGRDRLGHGHERIAGRSPATVKMLEIIDRAAALSLPIVIVGERGTGKALIARALHDHGPRKQGAFVAIHCSAPEPLLESELFGQARGSAPGADRDRRGLFEVASGGTLFLDQIADTSPAMQAKLLRVLQDGAIRRAGDPEAHEVDVRVIAASEQPLAELAAAGRFCEDLRRRLDVVTVPVPALRDRDGDVPVLVEHLLARLCGDRPIPRLTRAAMRALGQYRWPGNVRELENALARGVAMGGDVIDLDDLPEAITRAAARPEPAKPTAGDDLRLRPALAATEQAYVAAAMARTKGNQTVAARLLGLSRFGLQKKLRRLAGDSGDPADPARRP
jgi:transcriptional regulator with GAF, ATPase, and Fis domain